MRIVRIVWAVDMDMAQTIMFDQCLLPEQGTWTLHTENKNYNIYAAGRALCTIVNIDLLK